MGRSNVMRSKRDAVLTLLTVAFVLISTTNTSKPAYAQSSTDVTQKQKVQFPGSDMCSSNLQTCIDNTPDGAVIEIAAGTYTVSILLSRPIDLIGAGADSTILQAEPNKRVLQIQGAAVNQNVKIADLTIAGGKADGVSQNEQFGGGILIENGASPQLSNLIIRDNFARSYGGGIAVVSSEKFPIQTIQIRDSLFQNNSSGGTGGGLCSNAGKTIIHSTKLSGNHAKHGGAVFVSGAFDMQKLVVTGNQADEFGGGVYGGHDLKSGAEISELKGSLFQNNSAGYQGGGAFVFNTLLERDHFQENKINIESSMSGGGALAASNVVTVTKTEFINNSAPDGGAIAGLGGRIWASNSFFVDNQAGTTQTGAAFSLVNASPTTRVYLSHITIVDRAENSAAAIKTGDGDVRLTNSIITNHALAVNNSSGRFQDQNNLYFNNKQLIEGDTVRSSGAIIADPMFEDVNALNFHLRQDSAAIDAGLQIDIMDDIDNDKRPSGGAPDIGVDEAMPGPIPTATSTPTAFANPTATPVPTIANTATPVQQTQATKTPAPATPTPQNTTPELPLYGVYLPVIVKQ